MKVLVIGANGQIGRQVVNKLKKNSTHKPIAMVRKPEQQVTWESQNVDTVLADLENDFGHAFQGADAVIFTAGSGAHTGKDKTHLVDRVGAKKAIDLATKHQIDRFIMVSAFGADFSPKDWPDSMKHYYEAKSDADKALMQSNLAYTILKPGRLLNEDPSHKIEIGEEISQRGGNISRSDVSEVIVKLLDHKRSYHKSYELLAGEVTIDQAINHL